MYRNEIVGFVRSVQNGRFVGIDFIKADGSFRRAQASFGVMHPSNVTAPGQGIRNGVSFHTACQRGQLKFFEANKRNPDGSRGAYRSARVERILSVTANGHRHEIIDNQYLVN